jgi:hypothetical protein
MPALPVLAGEQNKADEMFASIGPTATVTVKFALLAEAHVPCAVRTTANAKIQANHIARTYVDSPVCTPI